MADNDMIQGIMSISSDVQKWASLSDDEVLLKARTHTELFAILVNRYEKPFLRKAYSIVKTKEDSEEIVQDTFVRIYLYADRYKPQEGASFRSWAYAILTRVAITRYRKLMHDRENMLKLDPEYYESFPDTEHFMKAYTLRDEVLAALSKIPEAASRVLGLQFLEGKTQEEIAREEHTTISAIKTRVHRAKKLFKKRIEHDYDN